MRKLVLTLTICCLSLSTFSVLSNRNFVLDSSNKLISWKINSNDSVSKEIALLKTPGYNTDKWVNGIVPGTVFGSYVAEGYEKDPNYGDNIYNVNKAKYERNFWYRTQFNLPVSYSKKKVWLNFEGVNRDADIYLNGTFLGKLQGIVHRGRYEISSLLKNDAPNVLAVLVYLPITPLNCSASPTYISSASWDWMPWVPGLNMGITDNVFITTNDEVTIEDPWIRTKVPSINTGDISVALTLKNKATNAVSGTLKGIIQPGNIEFSQQVDLASLETKEIKLDKSTFSQLSIANPKLWWPNGYGDPNMYSCNLIYSVDGVVSDSLNVPFGIKEYSYDAEGNIMHIKINGKRVFLKGGNWGMSDYMLRCRDDEYDTKLRLHKELNFNMIRNWIGSTTDAEFYQACDKYGIMVWDDFWLITTFIYWPRDKVVFKNNVEEKIKRNRNHPCIAVWCGMNEATPPADYDSIYAQAIRKYDGNDRHYHPNSNSVNLSSSGPWQCYAPEAYFDSPPRMFGAIESWGLRTELGTPVFTTYESFKEFIPEDKMWPRNEMWNKHFFGPSASNANPDGYFKSLESRYGTANNIMDFCSKAQLLNIETNKGMFEGWMHNMWEDASGLLIWMSQSAYPSMVWQTYDYYYDLNGAYWGAKKACEPIHVQLSSSTNGVEVTNTSGIDYTNVKVSAEIFDFNGQKFASLDSSVTVDVLSNTVKKCFNIDYSKNLAINKPVTVSSTESGSNTAAKAVDGSQSSRWASLGTNDQWIYVDLQKEETINGVLLYWESAYGKSYKIQTSNDAVTWTDAFSTTTGNGGKDEILFSAPVTARYVKMLGIARGTGFGYSLYEFEVYKSIPKPMPAVYFVRLKLKNEADSLLSENFYWRGLDNSNFTALANLPVFDPEVASETTIIGDYTHMKVHVTNPVKSGGVAFAVRIIPVFAGSEKRILPVFMDDNYITLMPGETRAISLEFKTSLLNGEQVKLLVKPFHVDKTSPPNAIDEVEISPASIFIYPNPVKDVLYVKGLESNAILSVYDMNGRKIRQCSDTEMNVSDLPSGLYIIRILVGKNGYINTKFFKK